MASGRSTGIGKPTLIAAAALVLLLSAAAPAAAQISLQASVSRNKVGIGDKADALCDAEVMDSFYYTLFPNFHPYLAYNQVNQRFLPYGDQHDM